MTNKKKQITDKQKKDLLRVADVAKNGALPLVKVISDLEKKIEEDIEALDIRTDAAIVTADKALSVALETKKLKGQKGDDGYTPKKDIDYYDGKNGDSYVLTNADKSAIAAQVKVPEKVIEKVTEVIRELPVVRETIKETVTRELEPEKIRDALESLEGDERFDAKKMKNMPEKLNPPNGPMLHPVAFSNLPDVSVVGVAIGQTVTWNGTLWVPTTITTAFPQMTTTQRLALSPVNGQTAYDTTLNLAMIYVNGNWGTVLLN